MRRGLVLLSLGASLGAAWLGLVLLDQQNAVQSLSAQLRIAAVSDPEEAHQRWRELALEARERAVLYEEWIEAEHLDRGMVVHRHAGGRSSGECDSLLFSSLRYTALHKLGWHDKAEDAWAAIERAHENGRWLRHPQCRRKSTSRDMIVGLLTAINQNPQGKDAQLQQTLDIIERTDGSIDRGPFYVSRLSPGIGELLKQMSLSRGWPLQSLPSEVRIGFSTLEVDTWLASPGYTSHLNALVLWNELLLLERQQATRSLSQLIDGVGQPLLGLDWSSRRLEWAAQRLAELDPENLFFIWLKHRSAGSLNDQTRATLLARLLAMPQFPRDRLPENCDRKADYLWQRSSWEYQPLPDVLCSERFHGVDFLWMVALLTDESEGDLGPRPLVLNTPNGALGQDAH
jgi:hypothetical protein